MTYSYAGASPAQSDEFDEMDAAGQGFAATVGPDGRMNVNKIDIPKVDLKKFNWSGARQAGYSDSEIVDYLRSNYSTSFDFGAAKKHGYSDDDIVSYLNPQPSLAPESKSTQSPMRRVADIGIDVAKGIVGVGESVVGIADLATVGLVGKGMEAIGYDPASTKKTLEEGYSDARKKSEKEITNAEGLMDFAGALVKNPGAIMGRVAESAPMLLGAMGVAGRAFLSARAAGLSVAEATAKASTAASITEGAFAAGSIAEQARQENPDEVAKMYYAIPAGVATAIIGKLGGMVPGGSIETILTGGNKAISGNILTRVVKGATVEGLEEAPQAAQEKGFTNLATDKPFLQDVDRAAVEGGIVGAAVGGMGGMASRRATAEITPPSTPDAALKTPVTPSDAILNAETPDAAIAAFENTVKSADLRDLQDQAIALDDVGLSESIVPRETIEPNAMQNALQLAQEKASNDAPSQPIMPGEPQPGLIDASIQAEALRQPTSLEDVSTTSQEQSNANDLVSGVQPNPTQVPSIPILGDTVSQALPAVQETSGSPVADALPGAVADIGMGSVASKNTAGTVEGVAEQGVNSTDGQPNEIQSARSLDAGATSSAAPEKNNAGNIASNKAAISPTRTDAGQGRDVDNSATARTPTREGVNSTDGQQRGNQLEATEASASEPARSGTTPAADSAPSQRPVRTVQSGIAELRASSGLPPAREGVNSADGQQTGSNQVRGGVRPTPAPIGATGNQDIRTSEIRPGERVQGAAQPDRVSEADNNVARTPARPVGDKPNAKRYENATPSESAATVNQQQASLPASDGDGVRGVVRPIPDGRVAGAEVWTPTREATLNQAGQEANRLGKLAADNPADKAALDRAGKAADAYQDLIDEKQGRIDNAPQTKPEPPAALQFTDLKTAKDKVLTFKSKATANAYKLKNGKGTFTARQSDGSWVLSKPYKPRSEKQKANDARLAAKSEPIDVLRDDLLTAIGKIGGINKQDAISNGIDENDIKAINKAAKVGRSPFRDAGGMSIDGMREMIAQGSEQDGYLDQDLKDDLAHFLERVHDSAKGEKFYSYAGQEHMARLSDEGRAAEETKQRMDDTQAYMAEIYNLTGPQKKGLKSVHDIFDQEFIKSLHGEKAHEEISQEQQNEIDAIASREEDTQDSPRGAADAAQDARGDEQARPADERSGNEDNANEAGPGAVEKDQEPASAPVAEQKAPEKPADAGVSPTDKESSTVDPPVAEESSVVQKAGDSGNVAGVKAAEKAALDVANKELEKRFESDLADEVQSITDNGQIDIADLVENPKFWDSENEQLTDAGMQELDRRTEAMARTNLNFRQATELSDLDYANHGAQAEAFTAYANAIGIDARDGFSFGGSRYVEVIFSNDKQFTFRFANHGNTAGGHSQPHFNVSPDYRTFMDAIGELERLRDEIAAPANSSDKSGRGTQENTGMQERAGEPLNGQREPAQIDDAGGGNRNNTPTNQKTQPHAPLNEGRGVSGVAPPVTNASSLTPKAPADAGVSVSGPEKTGDYPKAGGTVDGRVVRDDVPNTGSISASLDEYERLPGVREVPLSAFTLSGKSYSTAETKRIQDLAERIKESGEINPLIVVIDAEGPYILEGGHRAEALFLLGAKSLPAVVVLDKSATEQPAKTDAPSVQPVTAPSDASPIDLNTIPPIYLNNTQVEARIFSEETGKFEMETMSADEAISNTEQDIETLEAIKRCMGG